MLSRCNSVLSELLPAENLDTTNANMCRACVLVRAGIGTNKTQQLVIQNMISENPIN